MTILRALAVAVPLASSGLMLSCGDETAPSANCPKPPQTWDWTVQRFRAFSPIAVTG
jgi:hypothetical protein